MRKWIIIYLAIMLIGLIFWSCSDDDNTTEPTNKAPTCTITFPVDSATFTIGNNITVIADATDTDGTIAEVRFYFDDVQKDSVQSSPYSFTLSTISLVEGTHTIKATAKDNDGAETTSEINIILAIIPPSTPTLLSPTNGSTVSDLTPTFDWSDATGATSYTILVDNNSTFASPEINQSPTASTFTQVTNLMTGTYYWKVLATNSAGSSSYSSTWTVIVLTPPATPLLVSPTNGSTIEDLTPTFDWSIVTGATSYTILVDNNSAFTSPEINQSPTTSIYSPTSNMIAGTYYWKVLATNAAGSSPYSTAWMVIVQAPPPSAPMLVSPTNGSTLEDLTPTFDWSDATDATFYTILVDNNSTFSSPEININHLSTSTFTPVTYLLSTGTYYWKVLAENSSGSSSYTTPWSVIVTSDPSNGMVYVQGGAYVMGDHLAPEGESNELPLHTVTVGDFYIGTTEVTQKEWYEAMGTYPSGSYGVGDNYPAYYKSWYEVIKYCNIRSIAYGLTPCYTINSSTDPADWGYVPTSTNSTIWDAVICDWNANGYRLPTEAEWEYAARGGENNFDNFRYSGCNSETELMNYGWFNGNAEVTSHPVGDKLPNQLGIYDMSGNLWEWCWDWFDYYTSDTQIDPTGPATGIRRVFRSGFWNYSANYCRVAMRAGQYPYYWGGYFEPGYGFRLARKP